MQKAGKLVLGRSLFLSIGSKNEGNYPAARAGGGNNPDQLFGVCSWIWRGMLALICKIIGVYSSRANGLPFQGQTAFTVKLQPHLHLGGLPCTEEQRTISPYSEVWRESSFSTWKEFHGEFCSVNSLYQTVAQKHDQANSFSLMWPSDVALISYSAHE